MKNVLLRCSAAAGFALALLGGGFVFGEEPPPDDEVFVRAHSVVGESRVASVRSRGMGGAYVALVNGAASVHENPAALGAMCGKSVYGGVSLDGLEDGSGTTDVTTYSVGGAFSLNAYLPNGSANQAVGLAYKNAGFDGSRDTSSGDLSENSFTASYGRTFGPNFLGGVSVSIMDGTWDGGPYLNSTGTYEGFLYNSNLEYTLGELLVGGMYRASDTVTLGGIASYATGRAREKTGVGVLTSDNGDFDRYRLRGGASWQAAEQTLVTGDIEYAYGKMKFDHLGVGNSESKILGIMGGIEQELLPESLVLRGGLYGRQIKYEGAPVTVADASSAAVPQGKKSYKEEYWGFTAGLGARIKSIDLNYTLDVRTTGDIGHVFGMQYDW